MVCAFVPCISWADNFPATGVVPFPSIPVKPSVSFISIPTGSGLVAPVAFPKSVADLSMDDKVALRAAGYEPYKDAESYPEFILEEEQNFMDRQYALLEQEREENLETMPHEEYCQEYPFDEENCTQIPGAWDEFVNEIYNEPVDDPSVTEQPGNIPICKEKTIGGAPVFANNQVVLGSCCAAAKSDYFVNKYYISTKYERIAPAFAKAMLTLFRKEGGCGTVTNDKCGFTCFGIGINCLGRTAGLTRDQLAKLTRPQAEDIYYKYMWSKYKIGDLPDVISPDIFLAMVGSGHAALGHFREFMGLRKEYTAVDEPLVTAVKNYQGDIHNRWMNARKRKLKEIFDRNQRSEHPYSRDVLTAWMRGIDLKRENGCHVVPKVPLQR